MNAIEFDGRAVYPSKIVCIGRNYADHIKELGNEIPDDPVFFMKPNSSISSEIRASKRDPIHFEGEISFLVIGEELRAVGFGLDLTKRDLQTALKAEGLPWERAKSFDGAAVFSPFVRFGGKIDDLRMELYRNDALAQQGGCDLMLIKPKSILCAAKRFLSFEDGDIIMTGTPGGVGIVNAGDAFTGKIFDGERLIVDASWVAK
jgi:2-keto-4-pentenoate hydratase/2-oxohepta-3-ene-1,7-dioic acid hydratase in catechol pathway